jgi:outer membrane cobalamin receptor
MKTQLSTILILLMLAARLDAATIRGFVLDAASAEPLPVATITIDGSTIGTTTNLDGYFVLSDLKPGNYKISISYLGYERAHLDVHANGDEKPLRIEIARKEYKMKEMVISRKKQDEDQEIRQSPRVSTVPVDGKIIKTMPSLGGEMDVMRALQTIPGVKASSDMSSALYVRGGSPDQTLILMDHNVVYNPSHMFGLFSTFNADAVKRLELMKGGFPAEYGGRNGSVLEVVTNEGNRRERHGNVSLGLISAKAALEGPLPANRGSYAVSGRRTYFDPMLSAMRSAMDTDLPDYYFYDFNGKVNFDIDDRTTLTVASYLGDDVMDFSFGPVDDRMNFMLKWGNKTYSTRLRHALSRDLYISASAAMSTYQSHWKVGDSEVLLDEGIDKMQDASIKGDLEYYGLPLHRIKGGFWINRYDIKFKEGNEDITFIDLDDNTANYSAYLQDSWRVHPILELQYGLRGYYHKAGGQRALDVRLASVYHYDDRIRFKLATGRYSQFMNLITFGEGFSNFDLWIPNDKTMPPSHSDQVVLGAEWDREDGIEATTEVYYTEMKNLTSFDPMTDRGVDGSDAFIRGHGVAYGWEAMLQRKLGRLTGWAGYSLSWSKRRYPDSAINGGEWFYPKWDRRHDFILVSTYQLNQKWDMSASWRYNTGQGFTKEKGVFTTRWAGFEPGDFADYNRTALPGSKNNYRFPDDHRLDVTLTYNHTFWDHPAKVNISIFNLYSRRSYWLYDTNEFKLETSYVKLLPILPLLSYEVKF